MSYDDEDIYDRIQDDRIEQAQLASEPIPEPWPHTIEASLLSIGDLIAIPNYAATVRIPACTKVTVARVFPGNRAAVVECELEDGSEVQVTLHDDPGVTLLIPAGRRVEPYPRWTGAPA